MMNWKRTLLATAALLGLGGFAASQVNVVPQPGLIVGIAPQATYVASAVGLVPPASATDMFCVNGSTSRNIEIRKIIISGFAGTGIDVPVSVNYNHSLDTGGTPATGTALPVAVPTTPKGAASTSSAQTSWTAVPTVNDSSPTLLAVAYVPFSVTTAANNPTILTFGPGSGAAMDQGLVIPKASTVVAQICLNFNTTSISSGKVGITYEWVEY